MSPRRITKGRFKKLWLRIFLKKCCLNCKLYDTDKVECMRGEIFSLAHYFELIREQKGSWEGADRTWVGSGCRHWE